MTSTVHVSHVVTAISVKVIGKHTVFFAATNEEKEGETAGKVIKVGFNHPLDWYMHTAESIITVYHQSERSSTCCKFSTNRYQEHS